jgi:hypothetical protein
MLMTVAIMRPAIITDSMTVCLLFKQVQALLPVFALLAVWSG